MATKKLFFAIPQEKALSLKRYLKTKPYQEVKDHIDSLDRSITINVVPEESVEEAEVVEKPKKKSAKKG